MKPHNVARRVRRAIKQRIERAALAHLYDPDHKDLDVQRHCDAAVGWLMRAQDAGADRGVSYGVRFGEDFDDSYPETTGYICKTFVELERITGDHTLLQRAVEMADWEIAIQLANGSVMGGRVSKAPTPAVFNTGMVLLGWTAVLGSTGERRFADASRRAGEWLVAMQEPDGRWIRGNSTFAAADSTLYNVKAAWGLCEAGIALNEPRFVAAAVRNAEYCLSRQHSNGWLPECCLSDPTAPLLHTLAYSMQGLLGVGRLTQRADFIAGASKLADAEIRIMDTHGFLPGRQRSDFSPAAKWCCLTGSAQTSVVWGELYALTGQPAYQEAAQRVNQYLMARHDIRNADARLRGGVPGSWPVWGDYGTFRILNWATKYLVDALILSARPFCEPL